MPRKRRAKRATPETSLYVPVKRFLERLGFDVKGEICGCDLVALRGEGPPLVVVGELKLAFNLELLLQGIDRTAACDEVWLAVRMSGRRGRERDPRVRKLCRLLGFGLLGLSGAGRVELLVEPETAQPVSPFSNDPLVIPVFGAAAAGEVVQIVLSGAVERAFPSAGSPYAASRVRSRV